MNEMIYLYDGSFQGFLCCVFDSYVYKEVPTAICCDEDSVPALFDTRGIVTDRNHAERVYRKLVKCSPYAASLLRKCFLTCLPQRELRMYHLIVKLLEQGSGFLRDPSDETLYPVLRAVRHLEGEVHLLKGFVRFSQLGDVLGGEIRPKNRVLPLLRHHFCARYVGDRFFLYDRTHREVLLYASGQACIRPLDDFQMAQPDAAEARYRLLWKRFYDTIAIRERYNPRCRQTQMPKRYWSTMTEFQGATYFTPQSSCAAVPDPVAPAGIPAPETLSGSGPSAPESIL